MRVYLDNAASTPLLPEVLESMLPLLSEQFGNPSSIHAEGRKGRSLIEAARKQVAQALNCSLGEIFFTSGGTEASNTAIKCSVRDLGVTDIISAPTEHHCVLHSIGEVQRTGNVQVHWLPLDEWGAPGIDALKAKLAELRQDGSRRVLVSLMHANNEIGAMIDLAEVGGICEEFGALFHSDSVQTVGHFPLDLAALPVHFITGAAHKFHGPKGTGFLYVSNDHILRPWVDGGSQERNMRGGTENLYGITGLASALGLANKEMSKRRTHIEGLRSYLLAGLHGRFPELRVNSDVEGGSLYTVLSVSFPASPKAELLLFNLDIGGVAVSGGSACSSGADAGSHVMKAFRGEDDDMVTVRFSFSHLNTIEELDFVLERVEKGLLVKASTSASV